MMDTLFAKRCSTCKELLRASDFNKNKTRKDGYQSICKECSRDRSRRYYKDNREKHKKVISINKRRYMAERQEWIVEYLLNNPCVDCQESDILVLEFDHQRDKEIDVSKAIQNWSLPRLAKEVEKCEVVCANCHKRRTAIQYPSYKTKYLAGVANVGLAPDF